jgi:transcriptional regulator with XRE-family HTH domain
VKGEQLRAIRKAMGLTQAQLAERIAMTSSSVARMEQGVMIVTPPMALLISYVAREAGVDLSVDARTGGPSAALEKARRAGAGPAARKSRRRAR